MKRKHDVGEKGVLDTPTHSELSDLISRYSPAREAQPGDRKYCTVTSVESEQGNSEKYNNIQKQKKKRARQTICGSKYNPTNLEGEGGSQLKS